MKKKILYIGIFTFFFIILSLSPICGDDWGNYLVGMTGLRHSIGNAIGMYFDWEGRFISRVLINILTYHKVLWNIINSLVITSIIFLINNIINSKEKKITYIFTILIILLMNIYTFSQTIPWIAGNITYLFVMPLLLYYYYYIFSNNKNNKNNKISIIIFSILNFIIPMYIEHIAVILILSNILFIIYRYIKTKKIDKELIIYLILSILATSLMLLSPGSLKRSGVENIEFSKLSILSKIIYNIPNFIYYTFIINPFMLFLMSFSCFYTIKNNIKNKKTRLLLYIYMISIPILTIISYFLNYFGISLVFLNPSNKLLTIYYFSYIIIFFLLIFKDNKTLLNKEMFFYIIGISSNLVMMISPTWGYRTSLSTYIFLSIASLIINNKYIADKKLIISIMSLVVVLSSCFYLTIYISINMQYKENLLIIEKGIKNKSKTITIKRYPYFVNCNINPENEYHLSKFKKYYNISDDVDIKLVDNKWKYLIFYST